MQILWSLPPVAISPWGYSSLGGMMHTQDTKFEWPLIQWISVKLLLRLNINDNQFRVITEAALTWGIELQQVFYTPTLELITMLALHWVNTLDDLERMKSLREKSYCSIPTLYAIFKASVAGLEGLSFGCLCSLVNIMSNLIRSSYSLPFEIFCCLKPQLCIPTYPKITEYLNEESLLPAKSLALN